MKSTVISPAILILASALPALSFAGQAELTWSDPSRYTDVWPSQQVTRAATLKSVKRVFTGAFDDSAAVLPEGYAFKADITDVDLAGQVNPPQLLLIDPRLINRPELISTRALTINYFPAIRLNYTLTDPQGNIVLAEQDVVVNDPSYLSRVTAGSTSKPYYYESRMISDWFSSAVASVVK